MASVLNTAAASGAGVNNLQQAVRDVFSAEVWFAALPTLKFDQFSTKKTELGVQPGRTIQMLKFNSIKRGGRLQEARRFQTQAMSMAESSISVGEEGNAVGFSEFLLQVSFFDQLAAASILLGRDMAIVLDTELRDVAVSTTNVVYPNGKTARTQLVATDRFGTQVVKDATEALETNNVPRWAGDHYICFLHPHQARGMRDDNDWVLASLYAGATQIYTGEVGRYNDVRFVQTSVMPNGASPAVDPVTGDYVDIGYDPLLASGVAGNLVTIYQAVMFGEYSFGHATGLPVELRDNGVEDFGREHGLAWYAIWGQAILENRNIICIETA